ncbi:MULTISPECIES: putative selenate ABC transporter substrate-binding protein [Cyanophyceae]|uniref:Selenate ABC transporter substrate-binding protein n=1 Tax=Leptolyngbya subtilissima DQ-A4 TaxID=2933933 RepID=A0ABV0KAY8_9CYAN|nr:putative selenate ABC transporter substrate-binding protein [Nodosilinea sp. FACHB-141]MBD2114077.1 putative selenate ABC transporter substrate-binding protein [Nodosilinea sp. FACHB-141]
MVSIRRSWIAGVSSLLLLLPLGACAPSEPRQGASGEDGAATEQSTLPLTAGAIPDQDPEVLQRLYTKLADYLEAELGVPVDYKPVTDYAAAVTAFKVGDLDLVWFGGLTGVQARLQVPGAEAIAQRDIDEQFHSVFIANTAAGLKEFSDIQDLTQIKGRTFTFGSESSTSGRLMPQHFMEEAGLDTAQDFKGEVGFSGNHDTTIKLVEAGTYEVGALNEQVWLDRVAEGAVDTTKVDVIWRTPPYFDYHWVISPEVDERYGDGFADKVQAALMALDPAVPEHKEILDLFGAERFIATDNDNYAEIEAVGRKIGKIQ